MNFKSLFPIALLLIFSILKVSSEDADILIVTIDNSKDNNIKYNSTSYDSITATMKKYLINSHKLSVPTIGILDSDIDEALYIKVNNATFPKYKVIVFPDGRVSYDASNPNSGNSTWQSAIKPSQWEKFYEYSRNYNTRLVFLNEYPSNYTGTTLYQKLEPDEAIKKYQSVQNIKSEPDIIYAEVVNESKLDTKEIYHYPAIIDQKVIKKSKLKVESLLYFEANKDFPEETVAAVTVDNDGAQYAAFFMAFGDWSTTSSVLNVVWLTWAFEKDFRFLSGLHQNTEQVIKESSGSGKSTKIEILVVTLSTIFTIIYNLL